MTKSFKKSLFLVSACLACSTFFTFPLLAEVCPEVSAKIGASEDSASSRVVVMTDFMMPVPLEKVKATPLPYIENALKVLKRAVPAAPEVTNKSSAEYLKFLKIRREALIRRGNALELINKIYSEVSEFKNPPDEIWRERRADIKESLSLLMIGKDPVLKHWAMQVHQGILDPFQRSTIELADIDRNLAENSAPRISDADTSTFSPTKSGTIWFDKSPVNP
ncbi:MAG: hypothetical protein J0L93_07245 [Deltaproteobacteria bacterium]|nr:hypothetical protein [Deltaproteobacteria bacterium]